MNDRQRLEAIVDVVRSYLPPDGISREEAMSQIIGLVDPLPAQTEQEPQRPVKSYTNNSPQYATDDRYTKQQNVYTSEERVHEIDKSIHEEIERLKAEIKRANELAEYRLQLLMQMPENKPWVSLTEEEINEAAYHCVKSGQSVNAAIRAIEAALRSKNT